MLYISSLSCYQNIYIYTNVLQGILPQPVLPICVRPQDTGI